MDWNSIILALLSTTSLASLVGMIVYRKQNKKLKENEVKKDDVETQREQMNLGEEYIKKVIELSELNYKATLKNGTDNEGIIKRVDFIVQEQKRLSEEQTKLAEQMQCLVDEQGRQAAFMNGEYQDFLRRNGFKRELENKDITENEKTFVS